MKIKQTINEKPRLKKALKIIGTSITIFFAAFGVVCSGLLIGSCANQKTKEVVATTPLYSDNSKPLKHYSINADNGFTHLFAIWSAISQTAIEYYSTLNNQFWYTPSANDYFAFNVNEVPYSVLTQWDRVDTHQDLAFSDGFAFNALQFQFLASYVWGNSSFLAKNYQMRFFNTQTQTASSWLLNFDIVSTQPVANASHNPLGVVTNIGYVSGSQAYCVLINASANPALFNVFNSDHAYDFQSGVDTGYQSGYASGYQTGYDTAMSTGGMDSNPFTLISNAFRSIASILNIQVLPNLSLGVLIFVPIVVAVIIVIVRMVKG